MHPIVVHFAIALVSIAILADFLFLISKKKKHANLAGTLLYAGAGFLIVAVWSGFLAKRSITATPDDAVLIHHHQLSGIITLICVSLLVLLRFFRKNSPNIVLKRIYYIIAFVAFLSLVQTGFLGGEMVYKYGIGTGHKGVQKQAPASFETENDSLRQRK